MSSFRRIGLKSGLGAVSGSLLGSAWLGMWPGSLSGFSTTNGVSRSMSLAIRFKKLFTYRKGSDCFMADKEW